MRRLRNRLGVALPLVLAVVGTACASGNSQADRKLGHHNVEVRGDALSSLLKMPASMPPGNRPSTLRIETPCTSPSPPRSQDWINCAGAASSTSPFGSFTLRQGRFHQPG